MVSFSELLSTYHIFVFQLVNPSLSIPAIPVKHEFIVLIESTPNFGTDSRIATKVNHRRHTGKIL